MHGPSLFVYASVYMYMRVFKVYAWIKFICMRVFMCICMD